MASMTGARYLAETLHGYGITHFFFMPVIVPAAMPDFERLGIAPIMTHAEKSAAYMADAYARVRRGPAVCGAQSVGAVNLAAGLQDAYLGCSPVIALTGRRPQLSVQRHDYQEVDHVDPFNAVTKYNNYVSHVEQLPTFLRQAFREATSGTPGPAHLDLLGIEGSVLTEESDLEVVVEEPFTHTPPFRPEPDLASIDAALNMLNLAARPVIVAGGGVTASGAGAELVELAELLNVPVATSLNAKQTFPHDHALAVGVPGLYSRACANQTMAEADLVFFVGSHTGGQVTNDWRLPRPGTKVVQLDINPAELGRSFPISVGLHGDVQASLRKMVSTTAAAAEPLNRNRGRAEWIRRIQGFVQEWRRSVEPLANSDAVPMRPERLCLELTEHLPSDAVLVSDTGHSGIWTGTMIDLKHSEQSYIRCAGSLGWALPAAIGAKCAVPDRPVICFTGDGGVWYHLTELDTAVRYGINTVTIINNNASLNQEQALNERVFGGRTPGSDAMWMLSDVDFASMARSIGCFSTQVKEPGDFEGALDQALISGKPAVIDVRTDIEGIAQEAWDG